MQDDEADCRLDPTGSPFFLLSDEPEAQAAPQSTSVNEYGLHYSDKDK